MQRSPFSVLGTTQRAVAIPIYIWCQTKFFRWVGCFVRLFKRKHCDARDYTTEFNAVERHETREQSQTFRSGAL